MTMPVTALLCPATLLDRRCLYNDFMTNTELHAEMPKKSRLIQELIWLLGSLFTGLLVLPALIYAAGLLVFGAYRGSGTTSGITAFYGDYANDLVTAHLSSWTVALGPLVLVILLRLIFAIQTTQLPRWLPAVFRNTTSSPKD